MSKFNFSIYETFPPTAGKTRPNLIAQCTTVRDAFLLAQVDKSPYARRITKFRGRVLWNANVEPGISYNEFLQKFSCLQQKLQAEGEARIKAAQKRSTTA